MSRRYDLLYAEIQQGSLKSFLRKSTENKQTQKVIDKLDSIIADLAETVSVVPMVYMRLLYKAVSALNPNPTDVDVISGTGVYGQFLAVTVRDLRLGEVRFTMSHDDGFSMNAYLHLTDIAVELIEGATT